ncbi:MAG: arsenate reductase ArsC [Candidatus Zixiibacteriota bacterium]|nr:MAG: arsenate reductase ArsC [candidate division Zixibacteria bacterium]
MKTSVLFVCTHNSARSQMAEGLLNHHYGDRYEAFSAGTEQTRVHPLAIEAMARAGIDISGHESKIVDRFGDRLFDVVVTVCDLARATCPFVPAKVKRLHWSLEDPSAATGTQEQQLARFEQIRDEIRRRIEEEFGG